MPSPAEVARAHYRRQATLARDAASAVEALWREVDPGDLDGSFAVLGPRMAQAVALGQYAAAGAASKYVSDVVAAQGVTPSPLAALDPRGFAGTAADGGDLESLLYGSVVRAKALIASGVPVEDAMRSGRARAVLMAANETAQAGVSADGAAVALEGSVTGYRRMLVTPSCSRCILLAGKWFRWNTGFARHPRCDCRHVPDAGGLRGSEFNPEAHFDSMTRAQQDATFGKADAEALRQGADMGRVVNARQSTYTPTGRKSSRGTPVRATVEDCLRRGAGDRDATLAALDRAGYLRSAPVSAARPGTFGSGGAWRELTPDERFDELLADARKARETDLTREMSTRAEALRKYAAEGGSRPADLDLYSALPDSEARLMAEQLARSIEKARAGMLEVPEDVASMLRERVDRFRVIQRGPHRITVDNSSFGDRIGRANAHRIPEQYRPTDADLSLIADELDETLARLPGHLRIDAADAERGIEVVFDHTLDARFGVRGSTTVGGSRIWINPRLLRGEMGGEGSMPSARLVSRLRYTLAHELGHTLDDPTRYGPTRDFVPAPDVARLWMKAKATGGLSKYGSTSAVEGFAEAFVEWLLGDRSNPAVKLYADFYGWAGRYSR